MDSDEVELTPVQQEALTWWSALLVLLAVIFVAASVATFTGRLGMGEWSSTVALLVLLAWCGNPRIRC